MKCIAKVIILFCLSSIIEGQQVFNRLCPERPVQQNFQLEKYAGFSYEIARYETPFSIGCECGTGQYTVVSKTTMNLTMCCTKQANTKPECRTGQAFLTEPNHVPIEGKLTTFGQQLNESNYFVLSTDYQHYSIVYYCHNIDDNKSSELFWLISRQRTLHRSVKKEVISLLDKYFDINFMVFPKQDEKFCKVAKRSFYEVILVHKRHR